MSALAALLARGRQALGPETPAMQMLEECCELYTERGLLPAGEDRPLHEVCVHREKCWDGCAKPKHPGGVTAPWIGKLYDERRICLLGTNLNNAGWIGAHWDVCASHIEAQQAGGQGKGGRFFATGAMTYVAHVDASLDGRALDPATPLHPRALAAMWDSCAFVEAVKCSPAGNRSWPSDTMLETCPDFLLRHELEVLKPRVVVLLGRGSHTRDVVRPMLNVDWDESPGAIERDTFVYGDGARATLFSVNHPSTSNRNHWLKSLNQLAASVAAKPIPELARRVDLRRGPV